MLFRWPNSAEVIIEGKAIELSVKKTKTKTSQVDYSCPPHVKIAIWAVVGNKAILNNYDIIPQ